MSDNLTTVITDTPYLNLTNIYNATAEVPNVSKYFVHRWEMIPLFIITSVMRVFVYYVIFTKSEPLGTFKYYLLNQAVWSHAFELIMVLGNPVVLSPYTAGFMGGIFQTTANYSTAVNLVAVGFIIFTNNIFATILSLLNRYIFMFYPDSRRYLENKYTFGSIILFLMLTYGLIIASVARSKKDYSVVRQYAIDEGNMALQEFFYEPSFLYVRDFGKHIRSPFLAFLILLTVLSLFLCCCVAWFVRSVFLFRKMAPIVSKTTKSLLVMTLFQVMVSVFFLFIPLAIGIAPLAFAIPGTANIVNTLVSLTSFHGLGDMISTLYFVKPYWHYCQRLFFRVRENEQSVVTRPAPSVTAYPVSMF